MGANYECGKLLRVHLSFAQPNPAHLPAEVRNRYCLEKSISQSAMASLVGCREARPQSNTARSAMSGQQSVPLYATDESAISIARCERIKRLQLGKSLCIQAGGIRI